MRATSLGFALPLLVVVSALVACRLPSGEERRGDTATGGARDDAPARPDLTTPDGIRAWAADVDRRTGSGEERACEAHSATGMGSVIIAHEVDGKIVKIVRRTELAPPTLTTAYYYADDALKLAVTRTTDTIDGAAPPPPDVRYYRAGQLLRREGKPAADTEPDARRGEDDHVVARVLLAGVRDRNPDIRLPEGVW